MALQEELRAQGNWLFRNRSYLPLALLPLAAPVFLELYNGQWAFRSAWWWQAIVIALAITGLAIRMVAVGYAAPGTSGRNTKNQKAHDVNTTGLYSTVRHPLYLGNYLMFLAILLMSGSWWFALTGSLAYWLYYERIMVAEEEFLRGLFGKKYETWAQSTPAFIPRLGAWQKPAFPFRSGKAVRNENTTVLGFVASATIIDTVARCVQARELAYSAPWLIALAVTTVIHLILRSLSRKLRWLQMA